MSALIAVIPNAGTARMSAVATGRIPLKVSKEYCQPMPQLTIHPFCWKAKPIAIVSAAHVHANRHGILPRTQFKTFLAGNTEANSASR